MRSLVDCGATCSFIGLEMSEKLRRLNVPIRQSRPSKVMTATDEESELRRTAFIPLLWRDKTVEFKSKVLNTLGFPLVLGSDALRLFGVVVDYSRSQYFFLKDPTRRYAFEEVAIPASGCKKRNNLLE